MTKKEQAFDIIKKYYDINLNNYISYVGKDEFVDIYNIGIACGNMAHYITMRITKEEFDILKEFLKDEESIDKLHSTTKK